MPTNSKLVYFYPDNLEEFSRMAFRCGKEAVRTGGLTETARDFFSVADWSINLAAALRLVMAEGSELPGMPTPLLQWDADGTDTTCGRFAVGVSTGGFFGIAWGPEQEPVDTSDTFKTSGEARAWCEMRARGADSPVVVAGGGS